MNSQDSVTGYAVWTSPDGSSTVVYSLAAFGEIDAVVSDGYRRIPHGGVETAGLLFGTRRNGAVQIETFRLIACEHALGPSFVLSEADRARLHEQLEAAPHDPDLAGLEPVGWFVGHTRNPLTLSDREIGWFNEFFRQPGALTVLVKPERFQPTRFAFLLKDQAGQMQQESASPPVILPLSVQTGSPVSAPAPAIPAPRPAEPRIESGAEPRPESKPEAAAPAPRQPVQPGGVTRVRTPRPEPPPPPPPPSRPATPYKKEPSDGTQTEVAYPYASLARGRTRTEASGGFGGFGLHSIAVLLLAALLGCVAGYWAYLQLPSPVIPVSVREQSGQIIVEWPANQTDNVDYAALQVNDGQSITLSPEQKSAGRAAISAPSGDLKIDLIAKHWLRDSRGIVRYLRTPKPAQ
ncbi:MAG TPA: hypothetical protein VH477_02475 [Bryobacteraceae bacterium]|jgi:hypothetical protein